MLIYLLIIGGMLFFATLFLRKPRVDDTQVEEGVDYSTTVTSQKKEITSEPTQEQIDRWKEDDTACASDGTRSVYARYSVDEETNEFSPEYESERCCFEKEWVKEGVCESGLQKEVRGVLNEDLCEVEPEKEQYLDCCSYDEWKDVGECIEGVQKQVRKIFNEELCADTTKEREIPCCYKSEWKMDGGCENGEQKYSRNILNSYLCEGDRNVTKTEQCCFPMEWEDSADCKSNGMKQQIRGHLNRGLCVGEDYDDIREVPCCFRGKWENDGECNTTTGTISQKRINVNEAICQQEGDSSVSRRIECCEIGEWQNDGVCDEIRGIQKQTRTLKNEEACASDVSTTQEIPCCKRGSWTPDPSWNAGKCSFDGRIRVLREIDMLDTCQNNDLMASENSMSEIQDCCYVKSWEPVGVCGEFENGKQKFRSGQVVNRELCEMGVDNEKLEDCCHITDWTTDGVCKPDGLQTQKREVINRELCSVREINQMRKREEPCCYKTEWEKIGDCVEGEQLMGRRVLNAELCTDDDEYGVDTRRVDKCCTVKQWVTDTSVEKTDNTLEGGEYCKSNGKLTEIREVLNPEMCDVEYETTREVDCCYATPWESEYCVDYGPGRRYRRTTVNCDPAVYLSIEDRVDHSCTLHLYG
tara:strand:+ start:68 stop:1990 length:1923 start_codon:yes stop_codon:yes gene_type:complete